MNVGENTALTLISRCSGSDCRATGPVASRKEWQAGRLPYNSRKQRVERFSYGGKFAMTLIELVVVLSIIGLLAAIAVPSFMRAKKRAMCGLGDYRQIDAAKDQYALENSITNHITVRLGDLTPYLKAGSRLVLSGGKDRIGNPIIIGLLHEPVRVNPLTKKYLADAADDTFWGPFS